MTESPLQHGPHPGMVLLGPAARRPRPRGDGLLLRRLRALFTLPLRAYLRTYHRLQIVGREHLPANGSFVIVANHASHLDALCLRAALPRAQLSHAYALAAQDYFFGNLRHFLPAVVFANAIPFERRARLRQSLGLCRQLLAGPESVLILFPEGTRSTTGELGAFRPGIGALVAGTNVPVVPCAIQGTFGAMPKGAWLPRPRAVRVVVGEARRYGECSSGREASNRIAEDLQGAVRELLCQ